VLAFLANAARYGFDEFGESMFSFLFGGRELTAVDIEFDAENRRAFTPELTLGQRNSLLAHWISDTAEASFTEAAADLPRLLGLAFGRPRLASMLIARYPNAETFSSWGTRWLREAFDVELEIGARLIETSVPTESLEYLATRLLFASPPTPVTVARTYLKTRRLRAFRGDSLDMAILGAVANDLHPLTPVAPFGPLRLQVRRAIKDLADPRLLPRLLP
jgi:hypothetical protein